MADDEYVLLLMLGVLVVAIDGQILYQSGKRYLAGTDGGDEAAASMTRLIAVLFHLIALGVLALISTIDIGGSGIQALVTRLGVVFLVVALVHAIALGALSRIRESREAQARQLRPQGERERHVLYDPVVAPVSGQRGPSPEVSPGIESSGPYSTSE